MDRLPSELLLEVLSHLSYGDLKHRIPLVNKRFNSLLTRSSPKIDRILYRDIPPATPTDEKRDLNPVFDNLSYNYKPSPSFITIWYYPPPKTHQTSFMLHPSRLENCCTPAVNKAVLVHGFNGPEPEISIQGTGNGGSVTAMDVMSAVVEVSKECTRLEDPIYGCAWWSFKVMMKGGVLYLMDQHAVGASISEQKSPEWYKELGHRIDIGMWKKWNPRNE